MAAAAASNGASLAGSASRSPSSWAPPSPRARPPPRGRQGSALGGGAPATGGEPGLGSAAVGDGLGELAFVLGCEQWVRAQLGEVTPSEIDGALTRGPGAPNHGSPPGESRRMEIGGRYVGSNVVS